MGQMVTVVGWNVDGWHTISDAQLGLLDDTGTQLVLAQEVTPASLERLREAGWQATASLEPVDGGHVERAGVRPRFGCAVLARGSVRLGAAQVLADAPSPVRTLGVDVDVAGQPAHVVSAALPPGSMWGRKAKVGQARHLAGHLRGRPGPTIVGIDRNGPKLERWDPHETVWWREDDPDLFAPGAVHGLTDVLLTLYAQQPDQRDRARRERPDGPLEVSYVERRANPPVPRRYDLLLASRHWTVHEVTYDYEGAVAAGSDHAVVRACLELDDSS